MLEGIETLLPDAAEHGVRLGIEPLHPMMIADRSVVVTLARGATTWPSASSPSGSAW